MPILSRNNPVVEAELSIKYVPVDSLSPYARNARTHLKHQIRQIAKSVKTIGFTNPVLEDAKGIIISGHGRVEAAKLLGICDCVANPLIPPEDLSRSDSKLLLTAD